MWGLTGSGRASGAPGSRRCTCGSGEPASGCSRTATPSRSTAPTHSRVRSSTPSPPRPGGARSTRQTSWGSSGRSTRIWVRVRPRRWRPSAVTGCRSRRTWPPSRSSRWGCCSGGATAETLARDAQRLDGRAVLELRDDATADRVERAAHRVQRERVTRDLEARPAAPAPRRGVVDEVLRLEHGVDLVPDGHDPEQIHRGGHRRAGAPLVALRVVDPDAADDLLAAEPPAEHPDLALEDRR